MHAHTHTHACTHTHARTHTHTHTHTHTQMFCDGRTVVPFVRPLRQVHVEWRWRWKRLFCNFLFCLESFQLQKLHPMLLYMALILCLFSLILPHGYVRVCTYVCLPVCHCLSVCLYCFTYKSSGKVSIEQLTETFVAGLQAESPLPSTLSSGTHPQHTSYITYRVVCVYLYVCYSEQPI